MELNDSIYMNVMKMFSGGFIYLFIFAPLLLHWQVTELKM